MNARLHNHLQLTESAAVPPADEGADGDTSDNNDESATTEEVCTPPEVLNPDTNECEAPQSPPADESAAAPPADEGADGDTSDNNDESATTEEVCTPPEVLNPDTNECEAPQSPPADAKCSSSTS